MAKSLFLVLDEMNQDDIKNGTSFVGVSKNIISADSSKKGTIVKIGGPSELAMQMLTDERMCVMLIIDKKEYARRIAESK